MESSFFINDDPSQKIDKLYQDPTTRKAGDKFHQLILQVFTQQNINPGMNYRSNI